MTYTPFSNSSTLASKMGEVTRMPVIAARRGGHGGTAWSLPFADQMMRQPQDGAVDAGTRLATISSHLHSDVLNEPEDARLTGGTRSLTRRLLGLNIITGSRKTVEAVAESIARTQVA